MVDYPYESPQQVRSVTVRLVSRKIVMADSHKHGTRVSGKISGCENEKKEG